MDDEDFEGTRVLEQLATVGKVEEFFDAIDADDVARATRLMRAAGVPSATIDVIAHKLRTGEDS